MTARETEMLELACEMCRKRGKTWNGGDPVCSFPNGGSFRATG